MSIKAYQIELKGEMPPIEEVVPPSALFDFEDEELEAAVKDLKPLCDTERKRSLRWRYDLGKTVEFKAKLTRVELINPHSWIYFDVTEKDGKVSHHRAEMRSVHVLRRSGWTKETFPVGQQVTIEASPNRTDPLSCYLQTIVAADGTRMDRYGQYIKAPQGGVQEVRGPIVTTKIDRPLRRPSGEPNISGDWANRPIRMIAITAS